MALPLHDAVRREFAAWKEDGFFTFTNDPLLGNLWNWIDDVDDDSDADGEGEGADWWRVVEEEEEGGVPFEGDWLGSSGGGLSVIESIVRSADEAAATGEGMKNFGLAAGAGGFTAAMDGDWKLAWVPPPLLNVSTYLQEDKFRHAQPIDPSKIYKHSYYM